MRVEAELGADLERHVGDRARVRRGVLVVRLERVRQRLDGRDEGALETLEAARALERDRGLIGEAAEKAQKLVARENACPGLANGDEAIDRAVAAQRRQRDVGPAADRRRQDPLQLVRAGEEGLAPLADRLPD